MSLLPSAMRLPDDIPPLGKKVVPLAPPAKPDPIKAFERMAHPFPDGRQCPVQKQFFGFDFGAADMTSVVLSEMYKAALLHINPPMVMKPIEEKTATEMMLKQRVAEQSMRAQRAPDWIDLDHEVNMAAKRLRVDEAKLVRSVRSAFGGDVRKSQIESAISYVRTLSR